jgi:hypothetical protein
MTFEIKIMCDADGCSQEKEFSNSHPRDCECELEDSILFPEGSWLECSDGNHYCPKCAPQAANELGLEYSKKS